MNTQGQGQVPPDWPFDQAPDVVAVTVAAVLAGDPILHVTHDAEDNGWQFLDGRPIEIANVRLIGMAQAVGLDPSLRELADLPPGWEAWRPGPGAAWSRQRVDDLPGDPAEGERSEVRPGAVIPSAAERAATAAELATMPAKPAATPAKPAVGDPAAVIDRTPGPDAAAAGAGHDLFARAVAGPGAIWALRGPTGWVVLAFPARGGAASADGEAAPAGGGAAPAGGATLPPDGETPTADREAPAGREAPADCEAIPVWSDQRAAADAAAREWPGAAPVAIALDAWLERWTPGLERDRCHVAVFEPGAREPEVMPPSELARRLREAAGDA